MPVSSLSLCCICNSNLFRNTQFWSSSSSALTPSAITPFVDQQGRVILNFGYFITNGCTRLSCSPIRRKLSLSAFRQAFWWAQSLVKAVFSCTTSRGEIRPTAALEQIRFQIANQMSFSSTKFFEFPAPGKNSTTSRTFVDRFDFLSTGRQSTFQHFGNHRTDGVVDVEQAGTPSFMLPISSRLRTVNLSGVQAVLFNAWQKWCVNLVSAGSCQDTAGWLRKQWCRYEDFHSRAFGVLVRNVSVTFPLQTFIEYQSSSSNVKNLLPVSFEHGFLSRVQKHFFGRKIIQ